MPAGNSVERSRQSPTLTFKKENSMLEKVVMVIGYAVAMMVAAWAGSVITGLLFHLTKFAWSS
jgi:hypothetical protein